MKLTLSIFFYLVSFSLLASRPQSQADFEQLKTEIINELSAINNNINYIDGRMTYIYEMGLREFQNITEYNANQPSDISNGMYAGAQAMMVFFNDLETLRNDTHSYSLSLNNAIANIAALQYPTNSTVDLQPVLDAIASNTFHITTSIYQAGYNITNSISDNVQLVLERMDLNISNLVIIADILRNFNPGSSGGGGGSSYDDSVLIGYLQDIVTWLEMNYEILIDTDGQISTWVTWAIDTQSAFSKYFTLANSRLELPDASLSADLASMWQYCIEEMTNIVFSPSRYTLTSQVFPVVNDLGLSGVRLSNEGRIALDNLAFNQRQYLCSIEMLNQLKGLNNTNSFSWITNYLATIQQPYYELFNLSRIVRPHYAHYSPNLYNSYTNFLTIATDSSNSLIDRSRAWDEFTNNRATNWFQRIELQLMTLNGLYPIPHEGLSDFEDSVSDEENNTRLVNYSTNYLASISTAVSSSSNSVNLVFSAFQDLISSFHTEIDEYSDGITILPSIDFGGIQTEHVRLTYSTIEPIADPVRLMFSCVWWVFGVSFAFRIFRRLLYTLGLFVSSVMKLLGIILT